MKVLMNCLSSLSGGAVAYLRNLTPVLARRFDVSDVHELDFVAHVEQASLLSSVGNGRVTWISGSRPTGYRRLLWERKYLPQIARERGADVLFTPYQIAPYVHGVRNVMMLRNMEPFLYKNYVYSTSARMRNRLLRYGSEASLRAADRVIAVSRFARERLTLHMGIESSRVRTVYHGSPSLTVDDDERLGGREALDRVDIAGRFVLTVGSLLPYRRVEDVIAAFERAHEFLPRDMRLVVVGSGSDPRYGRAVQRTAAASSVNSRISIIGQVSWQTMAALYRDCTVCVIATEIEACPNIALEAMAAGCVIVSSDRPPLPEVFGGCTLEFRARDVDHLAQQMQIAVDDSDLRSKLSARAQNRARCFSWQTCGDMTYSALVDW